MADNVQITAGSGTTVATDDAGAGGHVQIVKLAIGTDGSATVIPADATNGLDVDVTRLPALVAGAAEIGKVGVVDAAGDRLAISTAGAAAVDPSPSTLRAAPASAPVISTTAYTAGDALGGLLEWTNINRSSGRSILIQSATLIDRDQERVAIDLVLFRATITTPTDNAAFAPTDAEMADYVGHISFTAGSWANFSTNSGATVYPIGLEVSLPATSLYGVLVVRGAPTYTATSDIQGPYLTVIQD